jgi:hypothetical protein
MADAVIVLRVLRRGARTEGLLAHVGNALVDGPLTADDHGTIVVRLPGRGPQAWDELRDALDEAGADWRQWLYLSPRPRR